MGKELDRVSRQRQHFPAPKSAPVVNTDWKLRMLDTAVTVTTTVTTVAWTVFDCTDDVPHGATHVLVEIEYEKSAVANLSRIDFRSKSDRQAVLGCSVTGIAAFALTGANQVVVPILSTNLQRTFQYEVTGNSFGTSLSVKILGYYL